MRIGRQERRQTAISAANPVALHNADNAPRFGSCPMIMNGTSTVRPITSRNRAGTIKNAIAASTGAMIKTGMPPT